MYQRRDLRSELFGFWLDREWAIAPSYRYVHPFVHGYAAVELVDGHHGLIDSAGSFSSLESICGKRPARGEEVQFHGFDDFRDRLTDFAVVGIGRDEKWSWGLLDRSLAYTPLPASVFTKASTLDVHGDRIIVTYPTRKPLESRDGLYSLRDDRWILRPEYFGVYPSNEEIWVVARHVRRQSEEPRFAFVHRDTGATLSDWCWEAEAFSEGFGVMSRDEPGACRFIDRAMKPLFERSFDSADRFSQGLAAVSEGSDSGYIDATGLWRLVLPYETLLPFNRLGWAIANRNDRDWNLDIIDREGRARLNGFETAVFWDGDFPYFETTRSGQQLLWDLNLELIYQQPEC